ncbi:hypothetical protein BDD12DRAFT_875015 [Trichophaea hybrida]|nr:hypothetical protein BDD12DRAFT_875015 [Trichophaea hybrida]
MNDGGNTLSAIAAVRHVAHTAETAISTAQIKPIESEDIKKRDKGKTTAKTDRQVITKARVITAEDEIKLRNVKLEKEGMAIERASAKKVWQATGTAPKQHQRKKPVAQVTIMITGDNEQISSPDYSESERTNIFQTPFRHPIVPPILNSPSNPNPRLPDRPLEMTL